MSDVATTSGLDDVLSGDLTVILAQVTPMNGVVLTPVNNFGWDTATRTVTLTSDLAAFKKLQRLERSPRAAIVFHAREHGTASGEHYIVLQGNAAFSWDPDRDELAALLDRHGMVLGPESLGGFVWDWWLAPFWWDRVVIRIRAERIIAFPDQRWAGTPSVLGRPLPDEPPAPQSPPAKGTIARINVSRAARQLGAMPHRLLGFVGADGYPMVVPVNLTTATDDGLTLSAPSESVPLGGRRAGLTGHWFSAGTLGQRQVVMTGWLTNLGHAGQVVYAPHTKLSYTLPPSRLLFRAAVGAVIRVGIRRARRAGVPSLAASPRAADRWRSIVIPIQRRIANPIARRIARYLPGTAVLETVGRRSGQPRQTPIGGCLDGSTFWLVTEFGRQSQYVRNIEVNPQVRLQVNGQWHNGTAAILDGDDPTQRLKHLPRLNSAIVRIVGTELLTIRIALD